MAATQLSIFLENRLGTLSTAISLLAKNNINIRALALAEKAEYGILRLIVNDHKAGAAILKQESFSVNETPVLAVEVPDRPGGLAEILRFFVDNNVNIEYIYAFVEKRQDRAVVVFRVDDAEKGEKILKWNNVRLLNDDEIGGL